MPQNKQSYSTLITAIIMADAVRVDHKQFRKALRKEKFKWHTYNERWKVEQESPEHDDMIRVLKQLICC